MIEPISILIIDDEASVRYLTKRTLKDYNSEIQFYIKELGTLYFISM
jgi:CheY-like chemotaxis protein